MSAQRIVSFGVFEADLEARELRKGGVRVKLQQQPFRVLQMLLERPGKVVTRGKLQSELWSDDTFVEFDKNLSTAVQKIRQALGDSSTAPRYVETVPRVGYRFIAPVDARQDSPQDARPAPTRLRLAWALGGLLALLLVGAAFLWQRGPTPPERVLYDPKPLTSYPGQEINPELSPDGNQVAFAWDGGEGGNFDIYLKSVGPGEPVRLTNHPTDEYGPAWSPDGKFIAFTREQLMEERGEVMIIPALGGRERKVGENLTPADIPWRFMAWTPDSRWLIFTEPTSGTMESAGLVPCVSVERRAAPAHFAVGPGRRAHDGLIPLCFSRRAMGGFHPKRQLELEHIQDCGLAGSRSGWARASAERRYRILSHAAGVVGGRR